MNPSIRKALPVLHFTLLRFTSSLATLKCYHFSTQLITNHNTMNILFWIYKSRLNKAGEAPIKMRITLTGQSISFATSILITPDNWDKDKQRIKGNDALVKAAASLVHTLVGKVKSVIKPPITMGTELRAVSSHPALLVAIKVAI